MVNVIDSFNTRYLINHVKGQFRKFVQQYEEGTVFDLAGCKLGPEVEAEVYNLSDRYVFVNSEDEGANSILEGNRLSRLDDYEEYPLLSLRGKSIGDLKSLIDDTPQGSYKLDIYTGSLKEISLAILFIMSRPDIEFDLGDAGTAILSTIKKYRYTGEVSHDRYYLLIPPNIQSFEKDSNGQFNIVGIGCYSENELIRRFNAVPYSFGSEKLLDPGNSSFKVTDEWRPVVEHCIGVFQKPENTRRRVLKLKDLLKTRKDD